MGGIYEDEYPEKLTLEDGDEIIIPELWIRRLCSHL